MFDVEVIARAIKEVLEGLAEAIILPIKYYVWAHPHETVIFLSGFAFCLVLVCSYNLLKARLSRWGCN